MATPVLKWAGGKRQLLDELYARFPGDHASFHEPFVGGGALFFDLEPENGTINDANPRLVNFYEQVRDNPAALIDRLRSYAAPESEPDADRAHAETNHGGRRPRTTTTSNGRSSTSDPTVAISTRSRKPRCSSISTVPATTGCIAKTARGGFNVPIGRYADPDWVQADHIRAASRTLEGTAILDRDFEYVTERAEAGDLVYFDPPYEPMSPTARFTEYSADGFGREDQARLLEAARELDENGVYVILSNSGVMYELYDEAGFDVGIEGATRAINSDAGNRDEVEEIIATNVPDDERRGTGQQGLTDFGEEPET